MLSVFGFVILYAILLYWIIKKSKRDSTNSSVVVPTIDLPPQIVERGPPTIISGLILPAAGRVNAPTGRINGSTAAPALIAGLVAPTRFDRLTRPSRAPQVCILQPFFLVFYIPFYFIMNHVYSGHKQ